MNDQIINTELVAVKPCRVCGAMDRNKRGKCKPCQKEHQRKYREENPEKVSKTKRKYYDANREKVAERRREHYKVNRKKTLDSQREYYEANREHTLDRKRQYYEENPDKIKAAYHNRRARIKGNGGKLSTNIVQTLLIKQNNKCVCCGASLDNGHHLDHIMPIALGGMNDDQNVQLLTPKCNLSKSDKHPDVWAGEKGIKLS